MDDKRVIFKKIRCIVCHHEAFFIKKTNNNYSIYKCTNCLMEFCNPMPTETQFSFFYSDYSDPRASDVIIETNAKRNINLLSEFGLTKDSRLLDYGSGKGAFCSIGKSSNWVNFDPYTNNNSPDLIDNKSYNWITMWGVLEHIPDPLKTINLLSNSLVINGCIALTTISIELKIPFQYKPPEHVTYWTKMAIECLFSKNGMIIICYENYVMKQKSDIYLKAILRTVPSSYKDKIYHDLPDIVEVPTNEIILIAKKISQK